MSSQVPSNKQALDALGPAIIRMAHPLAFSAFLRDIGAPVDAYFQRQGLPALCRDPNLFVTLKKAWALFDDVSRREDRMAGWHVGRFVGDNNLGSGLLKQLDRAPTLLQALRNLVRMVSTEASHLRIGILERYGHILFYTHYAGMSHETGYSVSQAYQLEVYIDLVRHFTGTCWQPKQIGLENSVNLDFLEERFPESQIRINQPFGYLLILRSDLHKNEVSPHIKGVVPSRMIDTANLNDAERLGMLLEPYLQDGYPGMDIAADLMDTSVRTLARRLAACGTSYQDVIDNIRFSKAKRLLLEQDRPINEVGWSVGFRSQANFTRMFRRLGGLTPLQFRRVRLHTPH